MAAERDAPNAGPDAIARPGPYGAAVDENRPGRRGPGSVRDAFRKRTGRALTLAVVVLVGLAGLRWARAASRAPLAAVPGLAADSAATLLVVLRASDCDSYRPLMAAWDRLHRRPGVRVVGAVVDGPDVAATRDSLERRLGVAFPVRFDVGGAVERLALRLGYGLTPLSVLLDRRGRARAVLPPAPGPGPAEVAARTARVHLEMLLDPGGQG